MAAPFPHHYKTTVTWSAERRGAVESEPRAPIAAGSPPEFDGTDQVWSPEHLLVSAVGLCLMLTFEGVARKARLEVNHYKSECTATVDRGDGGLAVTAVHVHVDVTVAHADDVARVRPLLETAKKNCIISNSVKAPVTLASTVTAVALD